MFGSKSIGYGDNSSNVVLLHLVLKLTVCFDQCLGFYLVVR